MHILLTIARVKIECNTPLFDQVAVILVDRGLKANLDNLIFIVFRLLDFFLGEKSDDFSGMVNLLFKLNFPLTYFIPALSMLRTFKFIYTYTMNGKKYILQL